MVRDIRTILDELGAVALNFEGYYVASNGKRNPCFYLSKNLTIALVSGYSMVLRARIVDRWMEGVPNFAQGYDTLPATGPQQHRMFEMDRDGFTLLAMGFTGLKALKFKPPPCSCRRRDAKAAESGGKLTIWRVLGSPFHSVGQLPHPQDVTILPR